MRTSSQQRGGVSRPVPANPWPGPGQRGKPNGLLVILQTKHSVTRFIFPFSIKNWNRAGCGLVSTLCLFDLQALSQTLIHCLQLSFSSVSVPSQSQTDSHRKRKKFLSNSAYFRRMRALNIFNSYRLFFAWSFFCYWAFVLIANSHYWKQYLSYFVGTCTLFPTGPLPTPHPPAAAKKIIANIICIMLYSLPSILSR